MGYIKGIFERATIQGMRLKSIRKNYLNSLIQLKLINFIGKKVLDEQRNQFILGKMILLFHK